MYSSEKLAVSGPWMAVADLTKLQSDLSAPFTQPISYVAVLALTLTTLAAMLEPLAPRSGKGEIVHEGPKRPVVVLLESAWAPRVARATARRVEVRIVKWLLLNGARIFHKSGKET